MRCLSGKRDIWIMVVSTAFLHKHKLLSLAWVVIWIWCRLWSPKHFSKHSFIITLKLHHILSIFCDIWQEKDKSFWLCCNFEDINISDSIKPHNMIYQRTTVVIVGNQMNMCISPQNSYVFLNVCIDLIYLVLWLDFTVKKKKKERGRDITK